jgi:hypothetical protein
MLSPCCLHVLPDRLMTPKTFASGLDDAAKVREFCPSTKCRFFGLLVSFFEEPFFSRVPDNDISLSGTGNIV